MGPSGCGPAAVRRSTAALLTLLALTTSCTSGSSTGTTYAIDDTIASPTTAEAGGDDIELIDRVGPLEAGSYAAELDRYDLSFTLGDGWRMDQHSGTDFRINAPDFATQHELRLEIGVLENGAVPRDPTIGLPWDDPDNLGPLPPDLAGWFANLPYAEPLVVEPVEISGIAGVQIVSQIGDVPTPSDWQGCSYGPEDCLNWITFGEGHRHAFEAKEGRTQINVFLDADPVPIAIQVHAFLEGGTTEERLAELAPVFDVLDSMEIRERRG